MGRIRRVELVWTARSSNTSHCRQALIEADKPAVLSTAHTASAVVGAPRINHNRLSRQRERRQHQSHGRFENKGAPHFALPRFHSKQITSQALLGSRL